jgi:hypothetical protein
MPINIEVIENGRIIRCIYQSPWGTQDQAEFNKRAAAHYGRSAHKVHMLMDARHVGTPPPGSLAFRSHAPLTHPNSGVIAVVGGSTLMKTLAETVLRLRHSNKARFFNTEEEAMTYLRQVIAEEDAKLGVIRLDSSTQPTTPSNH